MRDFKKLRSKPTGEYSKKVNANYYRSLNVRKFHVLQKKTAGSTYGFIIATFVLFIKQIIFFFVGAVVVVGGAYFEEPHERFSSQHAW